MEALQASCEWKTTAQGRLPMLRGAPSLSGMRAWAARLAARLGGGARVLAHITKIDR